jgi:hypothetical protein
MLSFAIEILVIKNILSKGSNTDGKHY